MNSALVRPGAAVYSPVIALHGDSMPIRANERLAWFTGAFVPDSQGRIPFRDSSWVYVDGMEARAF